MNRPLDRPGRRAGAAGLAVLAAPVPAQAHLVNSGFGPFYDGIVHLALTPEDVLGVLGLGLLAGLLGPRHGRLVMGVLPPAWYLAGLWGLRLGHEISLPVWTTLSVLGVGVLVAAQARLPRPATLALAGAVGGLHGFLNGTAMAAAGNGPLALAGIAAGVFVTVTLVAAFVVSRERAWTRIAVRAAGSWIAAIGLLMLGWALRPG